MAASGLTVVEGIPAVSFLGGFSNLFPPKRIGQTSYITDANLIASCSAVFSSFIGVGTHALANPSAAGGPYSIDAGGIVWPDYERSQGIHRSLTQFILIF
jgi:hypothetical protein